MKHVSSLDDVSGQLGAGHISVHCTVSLYRAFSVSFRCQKQSSQSSTSLCLDLFIFLCRADGSRASWNVVLPSGGFKLGLNAYLGNSYRSAGAGPVTTALLTGGSLSSG